MVVETMKKEHLSIHATMQEFGINDHKIIERDAEVGGLVERSAQRRDQHCRP